MYQCLFKINKNYYLLFIYYLFINLLIIIIIALRQPKTKSWNILLQMPFFSFFFKSSKKLREILGFEKKFTTFYCLHTCNKYE